MLSYRIRARSAFVWCQSPLGAVKVRNRLGAANELLRPVNWSTTAWEGFSLTRRTFDREHQPFYDRLRQLCAVITEDEDAAVIK